MNEVPTKDEAVRLINLGACARCGEDHPKLPYHRLIEPIPAPEGMRIGGYLPDGECSLKEVALCPNTNELVAVWHAEGFIMEAPDG